VDDEVDRSALIILVFLFCITVVPAAAAPVYTITYTISPEPDGSALWNVEYRVLLPTQGEISAFELDVKDASALPPEEVRGVMERSASAAAAETHRPMEIRDFSSSSVVQTTPTGTHGVIRYSFRWTGFIGPGDGMTIGDVFVGGLYLSRETTLVLHPPAGYTVAGVEPPPDQSRDDLIWYGPRSFGTGEPRIVLQPPVFPRMAAVLVTGLLVAGGAVAGWFVLRRKGRHEEEAGVAAVEPEGIAEPDLATIEERIVKLLRENGGALYQSEIARKLGAPKSTVSSALNELHAKGLIQKVRKGRENLIRLV
jgi:uncharacterized membrane protein